MFLFAPSGAITIFPRAPAYRPVPLRIETMNGWRIGPPLLTAVIVPPGSFVTVLMSTVPLHSVPKSLHEP